LLGVTNKHMTTENRQSEWNQVQVLASQYLENPSMIPTAADLSKCWRLLRLWVLPSFEEHTSWHIFRCGRPGKETFLVRRVTWDQKSDASRLLSNPMQGLREGFYASPTIEVRDRSIDPRIFNEHMDSLKKINIPLGAGLGAGGIDGTTCGVEISPGRVLIEWWSRYAPEWQPLVSWSDHLRAWLNTVCAAQQDAPGDAPKAARP
jgi:hypothetical protein